jgi:hypothetical protein
MVIRSGPGRGLSPSAVKGRIDANPRRSRATTAGLFGPVTAVRPGAGPILWCIRCEDAGANT